MLPKLRNNITSSIKLVLYGKRGELQTIFMVTQASALTLGRLGRTGF